MISADRERLGLPGQLPSTTGFPLLPVIARDTELNKMDPKGPWRRGEH